MTLIHSSSGNCDAKCYNAKHETCNCICGGRNHGIGQKKAIDNARKELKNIIKENPEAIAYLDSEIAQGQLL